jgi:SAM-dependent methyltransferase
MLGRQAFRANQMNRPAMKRALRAAGHPDLFVRDMMQPDGFSETMWDRLGFPGIETMDASAYEGAQMIHDLNEPVPEVLHGQFSFIFDGGTLEHVFNVPVALRSVFDMLAPGGRFVSANGLNGWVGHGLYQFNPDLVWNFWKRAAGCVVNDCRGVPRDEDAPDVVFTDVEETGRRLRLRDQLPTTRVYLYYEVEKPAGAALSGVVLQSDYRARWAESDDRKAAE